jgi:hypothetical protein
MMIVQNQTDQNDLNNIDPDQTLGSGVFAIPDPTSEEFGAIKKEIVTPITYQACIRQGFFCMAFKWVPRKLSATMTSCPTPGAPCVTDCAAQDLCFCINGRCK